MSRVTSGPRINYRTTAIFILCLALIITIGCTDEAKSEYEKCVQAETANDIGKAWSSCNSAIYRDPNSESGKAAAKKLVALKPKYEPWLKEQQEGQAEKEAAAAKAAEEAKAEALRSARQRVERRYSRGRDGACIDKGLPDYRWDYEGGTRAEIDLVASEHGCRHFYPGRDEFDVFKEFCCPEAPP